MIAGLPLDTWILMLLSTVPGLALVVAAYRVHSRTDLGARGADRGGARRRAPQDDAEGGPEAPQARPDRDRPGG